MNVSGTFNAFRVLYNPSLILPHCTIRTFDQLPVPLDKAFTIQRSRYAFSPAETKIHSSSESSVSTIDIRAVVLDKDNCFAFPHTNTVYPAYESTFSKLKTAYPRTLLIVSNSSGTTTQDQSGRAAAALEKATGVPVLRHSTKKPGCGEEVFAYFQGIEGAGVERPDQIAVIGDRLFTDVMMGNLMGARSIWIRDGVETPTGWTGFWTRLEMRVADMLARRGYEAPQVRGTET